MSKQLWLYLLINLALKMTKLYFSDQHKTSEAPGLDRADNIKSSQEVSPLITPGALKIGRKSSHSVRVGGN